MIASAFYFPCVLPDQLVGAVTFKRHGFHRFSCCLMQRNPFIKAFNSIVQIVVIGLHRSYLRSLPVPAWLVQSSRDQTDEASKIAANSPNQPKGH